MRDFSNFYFSMLCGTALMFGFMIVFLGSFMTFLGMIYVHENNRVRNMKELKINQRGKE